MKLKIKACSNRGCVRDHNEDMLSIGDDFLRDGQTEVLIENVPEEYHLFVSDGMGGHEKGEVASEELLSQLNDFLFNQKYDCVETFSVAFQKKVAEVSFSFNNRATLEGQSSKMGCTLSGIIWFKNHILLVNCGDSRTYRFRNGRLSQLTIDDTERGITGNSSDGKLLLECIGAGSHGTVKIEDITERVIEGDMFVICSDGVTDEVDEVEMTKILSNDYDPAIGLVERANDNGGHDNASAIVVLVGEGEFAPKIEDEEYFADDNGRWDSWS